jgi:hypothetical protein
MKKMRMIKKKIDCFSIHTQNKLVFYISIPLTSPLSPLQRRGGLLVFVNLSFTKNHF